MARIRQLAVYTLGAGIGLSCGVQAAQAHDGSNTSKYGYVSVDDGFSPYGSNDQAYNGKKVYLSSPRHLASGDRGECFNPGRDENVNGRKFNWESANGDRYKGDYLPDSPYRNIHGRGYKALVSKNSKEAAINTGWAQNRDASDAWGSDLHIVMHTNATSGCDTSNNYLLTLWDSSVDSALAASVGPKLNFGYAQDGDGVIGDGVRGNARETIGWTPGELLTNRPNGDVYVELQFHDNQTTQGWIYNDSYVDASSILGWAIDDYLDYP